MGECSSAGTLHIECTDGLMAPGKPGPGATAGGKGSRLGRIETSQSASSALTMAAAPTFLLAMPPKSVLRTPRLPVIPTSLRRCRLFPRLAQRSGGATLLLPRRRLGETLRRKLGKDHTPARAATTPPAMTAIVQQSTKLPGLGHICQFPELASASPRLVVRALRWGEAGSHSVGGEGMGWEPVHAAKWGRRPGALLPHHPGWL